MNVPRIEITGPPTSDYDPQKQYPQGVFLNTFLVHQIMSLKFGHFKKKVTAKLSDSFLRSIFISFKNAVKHPSPSMSPVDNSGGYSSFQNDNFYTSWQQSANLRGMNDRLNIRFGFVNLIESWSKSTKNTFNYQNPKIAPRNTHTTLHQMFPQWDRGILVIQNQTLQVLVHSSHLTV